MSSHYRVKRRCSKLLHKALIISILLAFASTVRQTALHGLIILRCIRTTSGRVFVGADHTVWHAVAEVLYMHTLITAVAPFIARRTLPLLCRINHSIGQFTESHESSKLSPV